MPSDLERQEYRLDSTEDLELLQAIVAEEDGVELELVEKDDRGFAPLIIVALIGAAAVAAGAWAYFEDRRRGGQIIDLRDGAEKIARRDKDVVYGLIVIIANDGKVTVEVKEPKGFFGTVIKDVLEAVQGVVTKSVESVAAAAKSAVGDRGTVDTEAATTT